jgi:hypothetical protein
VTPASRIEELETEARDQRDRLELYRARTHTSQPTTVAHLRQRERECEHAERSLRLAKRQLSRFSPRPAVNR